MGRPGRERKFKGTSEEVNNLAALVDGWLKSSSITLDGLLGLLVEDDFADTKLPSRSALAKQLQGDGLRWDLVEAVAHHTSATQDLRKQRIEQARPLWTAAEQAPTPVAPSEPAEGRDAFRKLTAELVETERQVSDGLRRELAQMQRINQLQEAFGQSTRALGNSNQVVTMLLMMLAQLESRVTKLEFERDQLLVTRPSTDVDLEEAHSQLGLAQGRQQALADELAQARREREDARALSIEIARQLAAFKKQYGIETTEPTTLPALPSQVGDAAFIREMYDYDEALDKLRDVLTQGREDLQDARDGLGRVDQAEAEDTAEAAAAAVDNETLSTADNPATGEDDFDKGDGGAGPFVNTGTSAERASQHAEQIIVLPHRRSQEGQQLPREAELAVYRLSSSPDSPLPALVSLRQAGLDHAADRLLEAIGQHRGTEQVGGASQVLAAVAQLRAAGRSEDALRLLEAVGQKRAIEELRGILSGSVAANREGDAHVILRSLALQRPSEEVQRALLYFRRTAMDEAADRILELVKEEASPERQEQLAGYLRKKGFLNDLAKLLKGIWPVGERADVKPLTVLPPPSQLFPDDWEER